MTFTTFLKIIRANRKLHHFAAWCVIGYNTRDNISMVILAMGVGWTDKAGRQFNKCTVFAVEQVAISRGGLKRTVPGFKVLKLCNRKVNG